MTSRPDALRLAAILRLLAASPALATAPLPCTTQLTRPAQEIAVRIATPDGRQVPVTLFVPAAPGRYPLIAFSHGAFSSPTRYRAMLRPLAGAGYVIAAPMHIDSEEFGRPDRPPQAETFATRNADMALALQSTEVVADALQPMGISIDTTRPIAMGHSYGALIAQLAGGARAVEPDADRRVASVVAVVGWSPPGPMAGFMAPEGWASLSVPGLTITGTADVLPGFVDDWRAHRASFDHAPAGRRSLWVGEGVDHYFGGAFGREKPVTAEARQSFDHALATTLGFIARHAGARPCAPPAAAPGIQLEQR